MSRHREYVTAVQALETEATLKRIRKQYGVPAELGRRVTFRYKGEHTGTIVGTSGARLLVRLDGVFGVQVLHPTWNVHYHLGTSQTDNKPGDR